MSSTPRRGIRRIDGQEVLKCILMGMTSSELRRKFGLSSEGLTAVLKQIQAERDRRIDNIEKAIRLGMSEEELAKKHGLSVERMRRVISMVEEIRESDFLGSHVPQSSDAVQTEGQDRRSCPRIHTPILTTVVQEWGTCRKGLLHDISEQGLSVRSLNAIPGEMKTLAVWPGDFVEMDPVILECECRWSSESKEPVIGCAGFKIIHVPDSVLSDLRCLLRAEIELADTSPPLG